MSRYSVSDAAYYERQAQDQFEAYRQFREQQDRMAPCVRCSHPKSYHGSDICGSDVCATGPNCHDEMHESGWCQCPEWIGEDSEEI